MSGTFNLVEQVWPKGGWFDGLLWGTRWAGPEILYGFPDSKGEYDYGRNDASVGTGRIKVANKQLLDGFSTVTALQERAVAFALDADVGRAASAGFSIEGFTKLDVVAQAASDDRQHAHLRFANTESESLNTAEVADFPGGYFTATAEDDGDIWFGPEEVNYLNPRAGDYGWHTHLHEIGHGLGLKHPHSDGGWIGTVAEAWDWMEYSVMSYRSYEDQDPDAAFDNEYWSYAQTFMMGDIAALQYLYGANYDVNADDTVYSWRPSSGRTLIDGEVAIRPGDNRIFATIWDGGGTDTYDLSAYRNDLYLQLRPGWSSWFRGEQIAELSETYGIYANGNIYNALRHEGDNRSLIENAIGGRGDDQIVGNGARNELTGGEGRDDLRGLQGNDSFRYVGDVARADGADSLNGNRGFDRILLEDAGRFDLSSLSARSVEVIRFASGAGEDKRLVLSTATFEASRGFDDMIVTGNGDADSTDTLSVKVRPGSTADLSLRDWVFRGWQEGQDRVVLRGDKRGNVVDGTAETDRITGRAGDDVLAGRAGQDVLLGGRGDDTLRGGRGDDVLEGGRDVDLLLGGGGRDVFRFTRLTDSTPATMDIIADLDPVMDRIDLTALDARAGSDRDDSFTFLGVASMRDVRDAGPGVLWLEEGAFGTVLMGNVNRNIAADFAVLLDDGVRTAGIYEEATFLV